MDHPEFGSRNGEGGIEKNSEVGGEKNSGVGMRKWVSGMRKREVELRKVEVGKQGHWAIRYVFLHSGAVEELLKK